MNSIQNRLGLRYTTLLINFRRQTHGYNAVSGSTVTLSIRRFQPKITKIQKIQQGTKDEGKWKEARTTISEAMVDHAQHTSRGERLSAKLNSKT